MNISFLKVVKMTLAVKYTAADFTKIYMPKNCSLYIWVLWFH